MGSATRLGVFAWIVLGTTVARACPLCVTETGRRVREGLFGPDFGPNLAAVLLPFLVCLGVVAAIHPGLRRSTRDAARDEARADSRAAGQVGATS